ncbi:unnamed protein product [Trichobilharzia szidati]|nr:unnamed protein product [Trichobilharzia szidati]
MALVNPNNHDADGTSVENIMQRHVRSPSQSSSVSSEELLIWSREGNDLDSDLFSVSPPYDENLPPVSSSHYDDDDDYDGNGFISQINGNLDCDNDDAGISTDHHHHHQNNNNNNNNNHDCSATSSTTIHFSPSALSSPSTSSKSCCLYYINGSSKSQLLNSKRIKSTRSPVANNGVLPSSSSSPSSPPSASASFSTARIPSSSYNHFNISTNLSEQRSVNTLVDDFIDLDIKATTTATATATTTSSTSIPVAYTATPEVCSIDPPEDSPVQCLSCYVNGHSCPSVNNNSFMAYNDVVVTGPARDDSQLIIGSTETVDICNHDPVALQSCHTTTLFVNENSTSTQNIVNRSNNAGVHNNTNHNNNNNNKVLHCQCFNPLLNHLATTETDSDEDLIGYSFPSSSSSASSASSASSCIHMPTHAPPPPPPPQQQHHHNNTSHHISHSENNSVQRINDNERGGGGGGGGQQQQYDYYYYYDRSLRPEIGLVPSTLVENIPLPFMLIPTSELASGDSLTCTVVNILRGLGLLDRCGVEDLCASLYDFWRNDDNTSHIPVYPVNALFKSLMFPSCWESRLDDTVVVTRSSSFTSCTLVNGNNHNHNNPHHTRRSTVPGVPGVPGGGVGGAEHYAAAERGDHYNNLFNSENKLMNGSCLVSYLLSCSYMGTSFLVPHSIYDSSDTSPQCCSRPSTACCHFVIDRSQQTALSTSSSSISSTSSSSASASCNNNHTSLVQPIYSSTMNWHRGCANNLVLMLTHHTTGSKNSSSSVVDKLLTGRFLPGYSSWQSVWPFNNNNNNKSNQKYFDYKSSTTQENTTTTTSNNSNSSNMSSTLALWFSAWLHCGAVPVLAQLSDSTHHPSDQCNLSDFSLPKDKSTNPPHHPPPPQSPPPPQELVWRHRLVYGVTEKNEVYLTNPNELVPVQYVLDQLSRQTEIRITKAQISNLWTKHYLHSKFYNDRNQTTSVNDKEIVSCKSTFFTGESLTLLARHPDPRWASMNIMGQVLCALRSLERWADNLELSAASSSSSDCASNHQSSSSVFLEANSSSSINFNRNNSSTEIEQFSTPPAIVIPSAQVPGISLFVVKSNWELVHTLLQSKYIQ